MISEQEIRTIAQEQGVMPTVIEKDYYVGILLNSISMDAHKKNFIFKGGTALRKCYFKDYRFSEDIDFTVTTRKLNTEQKLRTCITSWCQRGYTIFGAMFRLLKIELERETYGQESYKAVVHYTGMEGVGKVNIDLTFYEQIEAAPVAMKIHHSYSDATDYREPIILVYSLEEIIAEKLRAISCIQHYPRNRDVYDVWYLVKHALIDIEKLAPLFVKKCQFKGIDPTLLKQVNTAYLLKFKKSWDAQLGHQLKHIPDFNYIAKEFVAFAHTVSKKIYSQ